MSGYKIGSILSILVVYVFVSLFLTMNSQFPLKLIVPLSIIGGVLLIVLLLIKDKFYINNALKTTKEGDIHDPFLIFLANIIMLDNHFSETERTRVKKCFKKKYGWFGSIIQMKKLETLVNMDDLSYRKIHHFKTNYSRGYRLRLMQELVGVAISDKFLSKQEKIFIDELAEFIGLTKNDLKIVFRLYNYVTEEETEYQRRLKSKPNYMLSKSYSTLGLDPGASLQEVRTAYRSLAKIYHPDKVLKTSKDKEKAKRQFQLITEAYEILKNKLG